MTLLEKLQNQNLIYLNKDQIEVNSDRRLILAVKAASLGADIETIGSLLCWQEFEEVTALALQNNGYTVQKNVRFKHVDKRWEIDVVGCKKPLVVCVDCKQWQRAITPSALLRIVDLQAQRAEALAETLPNSKLKLDCTKWDNAKFVPAVLSLVPSGNKFCNKVPVVPILQFQDFISQLPAYLEIMKVYPKTFEKLRYDL